MKRFKLHLAMFLALGIVATGFSGCAKDYDDEIRRIENGAQENLEQLRTDLTGQLDAVKQQIWVLENTTMPAAIKEEADKVRAELAAVQTALEERIRELETSQGIQDNRLTALESFRDATNLILLDYGTRIGVLESWMNDAKITLNTLTTNLNQLRTEYDAFIQGTLPNLARKDYVDEKVRELQNEIQAALAEAKEEIEAAEGRAKQYTDEQIAALKQTIDDEYGQLLPDVANLLDKLGVDADGNLTVIDNLTGRVTTLEDTVLDLSGKLADIEAEWPELLDNVTSLLARVSALEGYVNDTVRVVIEDIVERLDAIDGDNGFLKEINTRLDEIDGRLSPIDSVLAAIGNRDDGLLGELFLAQIAQEARIIALETLVDSINLALATKAESADMEAVKDSVALNKAEIDALNADYAKYKDDMSDLIAEIIQRVGELNTATNGRIDSLGAVVDALKQYAETEISDINEAINGTGGILERLTQVEDDLTALTTRVNDLEEKVDALLSRIQSLTFVPETSSGKIMVNKAGTNYDPFTATFLVTPADKAAAIASGIADGTIEAKFIVNETRTRAITTAVTFTIDPSSAVAASATGTISLDVTPDGLNVDMFYQIALQLTDTATPNGTNVTSSFIPVEAGDVFAGATYTATSTLFTNSQGVSTTDYITTPVRKWFQGDGATGDTALVYPGEANFLHCLEGNATSSYFMARYNTGNTSNNGINILPVMLINGDSVAQFASDNNLNVNDFVVACVNPITEYLYSQNLRVDEVATTRLLGLSTDGRLRPYSSNWNLTYNQGYSKVSVEFIFSYAGTELWRGFAYILVLV